MNNTAAPAPSTLTIVLFSAVLGFLGFVAPTLLVQKLQLKANELFGIIVGVLTIFYVCGFTIFALRKIHGKINFRKMFVASWMSVLTMAVFVLIYYTATFMWLEKKPMPEGFAGALILKYNAFGMIFSSLLALIFKKE